MNRYAIVIIFETGINIVSSSKEMEFEDLVDVFMSYGSYEFFDWKEEEKADEWSYRHKSKRKAVMQFDFGDDQIHLVAYPKNKEELIKYSADLYNIDYQS